VQNFARGKIQDYLGSKLHTKLTIGKLSVDFPKNILLKNIYLEDQHKDSMLYAGLLNLDVNLWALFNHKVVVNGIHLDKWTFNMQRTLTDSNFNYDFIIKAFSSGQADHEKSTAGNSSWKFELGNVDLTNIRGRYRDDASGIDLDVDLSKLHSSIRTFNPDQLIFEMNSLFIKGLRGDIRNFKPAHEVQKNEVEQKNSSKPIDLQCRNIDLDSVSLNYSDEISSSKYRFDVGSLSVVTDSINLSKTQFDLKSVDLKQSNVELAFEKSGKQHNKKENSKRVEPQPTWAVHVENLHLVDNGFSYDDNNKIPLSHAIDYSHLHITNLNTAATALTLSSEKYKGEIQMLSFSEKNGFDLKKLS
jgi:uncharacterized protein involved in outer membrane biogenesis